MAKKLWLAACVVFFFAACLYYVPRDEGEYPGGQTYGAPDQGPSGELDSGFAYDYLAPYGTWVDIAPHGYCWVPRNMGYRWHPYIEGHWVWTDCGWTWISDYDWGWIPFHYGRWGWDDDIGWFWVPGTVWGPAWVCWRSSDLYFGWAPLPPGVGFEAGIGIRMVPDIPYYYWTFVPCSDFLRPRVFPYLIPYERNIAIVRLTSLHANIGYRNNRIFNEGFDVGIVRRLTRQQIVERRIVDMRRAGRAREAGGEVQIYRPAVKRDQGARPREYMNIQEARQKISVAKVYEPDRKRQNVDGQTVVRQRQEEERRNLERSQAEESKNTQRRFAEQERQAKTAAEKEKIKKESASQQQEIRRLHEKEKQDMTERQRKDQEQVRKEKAEQPKKVVKKKN